MREDRKDASSTDAATWCDFDEAVAACDRMKCSGVGFVFGPNRAYTGLDLDHVLHRRTPRSAS